MDKAFSEIDSGNVDSAYALVGNGGSANASKSVSTLKES
jgi:hypothetical protein